MKDDGYRPVKVTILAYKPPEKMTWKERNEEVLKRTNKVAEYTNQIGGVTDSTEIKFIKQRIKWNNDRIALLLG